MLSSSAAQGTPEPNDDPVYSDELLPNEVPDRPAKQPRTVPGEASYQVIPASKRPNILRSVVKGALTDADVYPDVQSLSSCHVASVGLEYSATDR